MDWLPADAWYVGSALSEVVSVRRALQEVLAAIRFGKNDFEVMRDTSAFSHKVIENALGRIQNSVASIRDLDSFEPIMALLLLAQMYDTAFRQGGPLDQIDISIEYQKLGTLLIPECNSDKPDCSNHLGNLYQARYDELGEMSDIDGAIAWKTRAVELIIEDYKFEAHNPPELANSRGNRSSGADLGSNQFAISRTQATEPASYSNVDGANYLYELAIAYRRRFNRLKDLEDLDQAILSLNRAAEVTPDGHSSKAMCLDSLGELYRVRFRRCKEVSDVDYAITSQTVAVTLTPDGHLNKSSYLSNLATSHMVRFNHCSEVVDINQAISYLQTAAELTSDGHPDKASYLFELGDSYRARYDHLEELKDMDQAIKYKTLVMALTTDDHQGKPDHLSDLAKSYQSRFKRVGELSDADQAIAHLTVAIKLMTDEHPDKACYLDDLGNWCMSRFNRAGDLSDLERAIDYLTQAVDLTPDDDSDKLSYLENLSIAYGTRVYSFGELARTDINQALACLTRAVNLTPEGHPERAWYLNALGTAYTNRFAYYGDISDIDHAIVYRAQAVQILTTDRKDRVLYLSCLGGSYKTRFGRLAELPDIDRAISYLTQAVGLATEGGSPKASDFNNLGNSYRDRFNRLAVPSDIDQAIVYQIQAVKLTPDGHPNRRSHLNNLGRSYIARFDCTSELLDVDQAIVYLTEAITHTPDDYPYKAIFLADLGEAYKGRFTIGKDLSDINQAISFQTQAMKLIPDGYPESPKVLYQLADSYGQRFTHQEILSDIENAGSLYRKAAELPVTDPRTQFRSARQWASTSLQSGVSPCAAYEKAMELVPHLIWLGTPVYQRYNLLVDVDNIALRAAAWAISVGDHDLALEWLEQGRSIVWNQILQLRTPLDELSIVDQKLGEDLKRVARELGDASLQSAPVTSSVRNVLATEQQTQRHHELASEWQTLLQKVRSSGEFENFMSRRGASELKPAAVSGPVVVINVDSSRCDALVILPNTGKISHVPLPTFTLTKAKDTRSQLISVIGGRGSRARYVGKLRPKSKAKSIEDTLRTLWSDLVKPILVDFLGYKCGLPIDEMPRVTWCTTGPLSFLPLHAAGCYDLDEPQINAMDLVISSYTPTLSALMDSNCSPNRNPGVLAVSQEATPGLDPLPNTVLELSAIERLTRGIRLTQLAGANALVSAVLDAMEDHNCVHLACHATQNPDNPAQSTFHLHDGGLTLEAITNRAFKNKSLAFLSACQTAAGDDKRPDESIHLAAGMLMAGYPSVIATMWSIWDEDGPEVAGSVYGELIKGGKLDCRDTARALHKAVANLREKVKADSNGFQRWVPFIHIGM